MNRDSLIVKLMREKGWSLAEAEEFTADMPEPEPEPDRNPWTGEVRRPRQAWEAGDTVQVRREGKGDDGPPARFMVAQRGANGLTATQQAAIDTGLALCPNCHENPHLPGCARAGEFPMNPKAVTKGVLPPAG